MAGISIFPLRWPSRLCIACCPLLARQFSGRHLHFTTIRYTFGVLVLGETLELAHILGMVGIFVGLLLIDGRLFKNRPKRAPKGSGTGLQKVRQ